MSSRRQRPFSVKDAVGSYLPLMHELASRIDLVRRICYDEYDIPFPYAREFIYLQLRQVCELIALGCLQLHGDLPIASSVSAKSEWNAGKIMHLLSKHHAHCFPQCVKRDMSHKGWEITVGHDPNALTFYEYNQLYKECRKYLHRGSIRSIKAAGPLSQNDFENLARWHRKIVSLMNEHLIGRSSAASFYLVSLRTTSGYPECSSFTKSTQNGIDVESYSMKIDDSGYEHIILAGNMKPMTL